MAVAETGEGRPRARVLEIGPAPPPMGGWSMRIAWLRRQLLADGHDCVILNVGANRAMPSADYEMVGGALDYLRKVWSYSRRGYVAHTHANGDSLKGLLLALAANLLNRFHGARPVLTFHAGVEQDLFPKRRAPRYAPLFRLLFLSAPRIICNSEAVKRRIVEYGVRPARIFPIPAFTRQYLEFTPVVLEERVERFFARCGQVAFAYIRVQPAYHLDTLIDGFAKAAAVNQELGLMLLGVAEDVDELIWARCRTRIAGLGLEGHVLVVPDADHATFLTMLTRSAVYVRTHTADGVASSVLESLALGVPVIATENGTRPDAVITFGADQPGQLAERLLDTVGRRSEIVAGMQRPVIRDTLAEEVALLVGAECARATEGMA